MAQAPPPEDRDRVLAADEHFEKEGKERYGEEYRLIAKDGSVVWVREEAVLVKDGEGRPLFWQGIFYDLTERKEAEEALRRSEERSTSSFGMRPSGWRWWGPMGAGCR
jgi:PAS domain S-box-containing protein